MGEGNSRRIGQIQSKPPDASHAAGKLLCTAVHRNDVGIASVQGANERTNRGSSNNVNGDSSLLKGSDDADLSDSSCTTTTQHQTHGLATESSGESVKVSLEL